ncbi:MAG: family 10 glycosylhydrolase, partial [Clostridia bacterium]|nr:family 10 glycosylhydrolase [Clostridia bacterium]
SQTASASEPVVPSVPDVSSVPVSSSVPVLTPSAPSQPSEETRLPQSSQVSSVPTVSSQPTAVQSEELRGVWISFYELSDVTEYEDYVNRIDTMFDAVAAQGLNAVFFHARPMSDAMYRSEIFPFSHIIGFKAGDKAVQGVDPGYDPLKYAVSAAHERGLQLHAWINPYRVWNSSDDVDDLSAQNPAYVWRNDSDASNDGWVIEWEDRIYYNPGVAEVRALIVDGVREIVSNYDVDGIHFDDYFYPTADAEFDEDTYQAYRDAGGTLALDDWRRENVNALVRDVYAAVKELDDIPFGISPAANIVKNYEQLYADVMLWASVPGYVDYLCPQIYFGFKHQTLPFLPTLSDWMELRTCAQVKMYVGLPTYKLGEKDSGAGGKAEQREFINETAIIARMVEALRVQQADGFVLYSYTSVTASSNADEMDALAALLR